MHISAVLYDRPGYTGGPAVNLCRLLPALRARGHRVSCLVLYQGGEAPNGRMLEADGIDCHFQALEPLGWYTERILVWLLSRLGTLRPDVFIANNSVPAAYAGRWTRAAGIPSISTHRSHDRVNWAIAETFGQAGSPWAATAMVCVSDYLRREMQTRWNSVPLQTIPSGVPLSSHVADQRGPGLRLVYAGRLETEQKAILELCDHLFPWVSAHADAELTLLGEGPERDAIVQRIETEGLGGRIRVLTPLRGDAYHEELARHHLILLYSHYEGTPGAVMDGMSCGLVPLVRDIPGIGALVDEGRNGFLFPEMGSTVLERIETLQKSPVLRDELGTAARSTIEAGFSIERCTDLWETLLVELAGATVRRGPMPSPGKWKLPPPHPDFGTEDLREPVRTSSRWQRFTQCISHPFAG